MITKDTLFESSLLSAFFDMSVNVYVIDADDKIVYCNEHQAKLLGFENKEEVLGKSLYDLYPVEIAKEHSANNALVLKTGEEQTFLENVIVKAKPKVFNSQKKPFYSGGKIVGVIGISTDITAQKSIEKELSVAKETAEKILGNSISSLATTSEKSFGETYTHKKSPEDYLLEIKDYFEGLIANIPIHIYWIDRKGIYRGCNDLQANTLGISSRTEIVGKTNSDLKWHQESSVELDKLDSVNEKVMTSGVTRTIEEVGTATDGTPITYLSTKAPLHDSEGSVIGLIGASIDITAQKEAEELRIAKERSEAANRIKTDYLANVFHDVRTPINWINGAIDMLKVGGLEPWEVERKYDLMEHASNLIIRLADDIADVAKVENNELVIKPTMIDLSSVIRGLEEQISYYKTENTIIQIDTFFDIDDPFFVEVDGVRLFQVLLNLLTNACKSVAEKERGLALLACDLKEKRMYFSVKDNGIGIPEEKQKTIFERFEKVNQQVTGKGIGLSISQRIVQLMGDDIQVSSKLGEGSTFSFSIPYIRKNNDDPMQEEQKSIQKPNWKDKTVLIVEDIEQNFWLLQMILAPTNCNILHASNGKKAIKMFEENSTLDMVLLDLGLPDTPGVEVLKQIRKQNTDIPVIVQTAYAVQSKKEELMKSGANDFITKPIRTKNLIESMEKGFELVA